MNLNFDNVPKTIDKLHSGDFISDQDLYDAINCLDQILMVCKYVNSPSVPEYAVMAKAIYKDLSTLQSYELARKEKQEYHPRLTTI